MSVFISGLAMRFRFADGALDAQIAGPAIYASVGFAAMGGTPHILAAISSDVEKWELAELGRLGIAFDGLERKERPSLILEIPKEETSHKLSDNPLVWMPTAVANFKPGDVLFASNGDPEWLQRVIRRNRPGFLGLDMHITWATIRPMAMDYCVRSVDFLSATEEEMTRVSRETLANLRERKTIVMRKRGADGVSISSGRQECVLPSPRVASIVSDIGAGDLLFGAMAAAAQDFEPAESRLSTFCRVYEEAAALVALLLQSRGPTDLFHRLHRAF